MRHEEILKPAPGKPSTLTLARSEALSKQSYGVLRAAFTVLPLIAGVDKFFNLLANWEGYLAPPIAAFLGTDAMNFMMAVGAAEIIAGLGVAIKPRIFSYVVTGWLCAIIVNLLMGGIYLDIAMRDLGLAFGAFALARLSQAYDVPKSVKAPPAITVVDL